MLSQKHSLHSAAEAENMKSSNSTAADGETVVDMIDVMNEQTGVEMGSKSKFRGKSKLD